MDVAKANQTHVKVHRILSNTHRQASVSAQFLAALPWAGRLGTNPHCLVSGHGLGSVIWEVPSGGFWVVWPELGCPPVVWQPAPGPVQTSME